MSLYACICIGVLMGAVRSCECVRMGVLAWVCLHGCVCMGVCFLYGCVYFEGLLRSDGKRPEGLEFIADLGRHLTQATGEPRESSFFLNPLY